MQWNETKRTQILKGIYGLGYILLIIGTILYFEKQAVAPFLFSLGAVFLLVVRIILPIDSVNFKTKRLNTIHAFATLILLASAYGMFVHYYLWIAGLCLSTLIDLYVSFRLPKHNQQEE
ncbi:hypothetical protein [Microbacter margulisiae]|uniref:Biotin synthase-like enzyme n=1 Tax=Microbacter margulisiae TaxID=1350067 RepID=A0A7W5H1U1_9PORP|nr:hypothetical protein [Microbacter margulisiae]MBB3187040.1 biotin synthase-like enzyme [Microbacter margulisiae]